MGTLLFGCLLAGVVGIASCVGFFIWGKVAKFQGNGLLILYVVYALIFLSSIYLFINPYMHVNYNVSLIVFIILCIPCLMYSVYYTKCYYLSNPVRKAKYETKIKAQEDKKKNSWWYQIPLLIRIVIWIFSIVFIVEFVFGLILGFSIGLS